MDISEYVVLAKAAFGTSYDDYEKTYSETVDIMLLPFIWDYWCCHEFPAPTEVKKNKYKMTPETCLKICEMFGAGLNQSEAWEKLSDAERLGIGHKYLINWIRQKYRTDLEDEITKRKILAQAGILQNSEVMYNTLLKRYYDAHPEERKRKSSAGKNKVPDELKSLRMVSRDVAAKYKRWENEDGDNYRVSLLKMTDEGLVDPNTLQQKSFEYYPNYHDLQSFFGGDKRIDFYNAEGFHSADETVIVVVHKGESEIKDFAEKKCEDLIPKGSRFFVIERKKGVEPPSLEELMR